MSKIITSKTIDQIKFKRKTTKMNMGTSLQETTQETEGGCGLLNPFGDDNNIEATPGLNVEYTTNEWKMEIRNAIEALTEVPPQARDLYNKIHAI
jgi:hypothetical protein